MKTRWLAAPVTLALAVLVTLALAGPTLAHITPPVVLASDRDALTALLAGARRFFVREVRLSAAQRDAAQASKASYQQALAAKGFGLVTTEIIDAPEFYFAEDYHQQYLAKVPHGYCGLGGTGVACQIGTGVRASHA